MQMNGEYQAHGVEIIRLWKSMIKQLTDDDQILMT